jgi:predicted  nucleic acid-binding Zn-ribbon protein
MLQCEKCGHVWGGDITSGCPVCSLNSRLAEAEAALADAREAINTKTGPHDAPVADRIRHYIEQTENRITAVLGAKCDAEATLATERARAEARVLEEYQRGIEEGEAKQAILEIQGLERAAKAIRAPEQTERQRDRAEKAESERDVALARVRGVEGRLRATAQILIAEVGADGPMNAEDAARRVGSAIAAARAEAVREFAEWANGNRGYWIIDEGEPERKRFSFTVVLDEYLASLAEKEPSHG